MTWKCDDAIDGDTINVTPNWKWNDQSGSRVRLAGVDAPELHEPGGQQAKRKLLNLVYGKEVDLRNVQTLSYGRLVCDVYVGGSNVVAQL